MLLWRLWRPKPGFVRDDRFRVRGVGRTLASTFISVGCPGANVCTSAPRATCGGGGAAVAGRSMARRRRDASSFPAAGRSTAAPQRRRDASSFPAPPAAEKRPTLLTRRADELLRRPGGVAVS